MHVDEVQGGKPRGRVVIRPGEPLRVKGWAIASGMEPLRSESFLMLRSPKGERLFTAPLPRVHRHDVAFRHRTLDPRVTRFAGFEVELESGALLPGEYKLSVVQATKERVAAAFSEHRVVVE
jgi:hypothetical protein